MTLERTFRECRVLPFLKTLKNTAYFPIQQVAIVGDADYILCVRGKFIWLELKTNTGVQSALQKFKADWVESTGGVAILCRPHSWDKVQLQLKLLDEGKKK